MTKTVDQWAAEACGVEFKQTWKGQAWYLNGKLYENIEWTIKDPRCREIFRDSWLDKDTGNAVLIFNDEVTYFRDYAYGQGDPTARDTEEACITAIYEASQ